MITLDTHNLSFNVKFRNFLEKKQQKHFFKLQTTKNKTIFLLIF